VRIVQAVALGNIVADIINCAEPGVALKRFYSRAEQWLGLRPAQCDQIVSAAASNTRDIARLFDLDVGAMPAADALLAKAGDQLREIALPFTGNGRSDSTSADLDQVSGLPGRATLSQNVVAGFEQAQAGGRPLSLILIGIDGLDALTTAGTHVRDAALRVAAEMLKDHFAAGTEMGVLVCRYDHARFAVLLSGVDRLTASNLAESARDLVGRSPLGLEPPGLQPMSVPVTISGGLATLDDLSRERVTDPETLVGLAEQALAAAQRSGAGAVRVFTPRATGFPGSGRAAA
jgi:diguanylate cyclase (GGDEF)-like protein